ncbi:hypothetical protein IWX90DRAFT_440901 [Phyllosticta citrichinensis]|uniref:Uncharacterized protein n=1 Tax=Phyllosticta citrichinensis TaxID=1130410 RepID=A0ABR1XLV0_9PEZI
MFEPPFFLCEAWLLLLVAFSIGLIRVRGLLFRRRRRVCWALWLLGCLSAAVVCLDCPVRFLLPLEYPRPDYGVGG